MQTTSPSAKKADKYQQKLKIIDQHALRTNKVEINNPDYDFILKIIALKILSEPPVEMFANTTKTIIFDKLAPKRLFILNQTAEKDKRFILHIKTHTQAKITISFEQQKGTLYSLQTSKAIEISRPSWNKMDIVVEIDKLGMISQVRLLLSQIKVNRDIPKKIGVSKRPKIDLQLQEYLKQTRGKTADIIRQRSLNRLKENLARRSTASLRESKRSTELIQTKSELLKFQRQKSLYLKHVEKMSPQKVNQLKNAKLSYEQTKRQQIANCIKMIYAIKLALYYRSEASRILMQKYKLMGIRVKVRKFIRILKNKMRVKITERTRLRMNILHNLKMMPHMIKPCAITKAKKVLIEALTPYMQFRGLQEITTNSEEYLSGVKKIQQFMRMKRLMFRQRISIMIDKFSQKLKLKLSNKNKQKVIKKYLQLCLSKKSTKFFLNKSLLLELLYENAQ